MTKKLNFSTLHESVLQRYVFENLSFGSANEKRKLLPSFLKDIAIELNAVIPEYHRGEHRADFVLIFNDREINLEIEWKSSRFNHPVRYYKNKKGYLIVIKNDKEKSKVNSIKNSDIEVVEIDLKIFEEWFSVNSSQLLDDVLISKNILDFIETKAWIIYLRKNNSNFETGVSNKVWAFKNNKNIAEIIRIKKRDIILFITIKEVNPSTTNLPSNVTFKLDKVSSFECSKGHFFEITTQGTCFEPRKAIIKREFIHFVGLGNKVRPTKNNLEIKSSKLDKCVKESIIFSYNHSGAPSGINISDYKKFRNLIR